MRIKEGCGVRCRACNRLRKLYSRGLCYSCYYEPGIREQYPPTHKNAQEGYGVRRGYRPIPDSPTSALPGTPEKVSVLEERARREQKLWHPQDARAADGRIPEEDESCVGFLIGSHRVGRR